MSDFDFEPIKDPFSPTQQEGSPAVTGWQTDAATVRYALASMMDDATEFVTEAERALERLCVLVARQDTALTAIAAPKPGQASAPEIARCALGWPSHFAGGGDET